MVYIKRSFAGNSIYVQVVKSRRIRGKSVPIQEFICSLGEINQLIKKLQIMKNG